MNRIIIAAPASGSGKTTVTLGIMAALRKRGMKVAPFKVGPDFIDPGYHGLATGRRSINLDGWICAPDFIRDTFSLHAEDADVAVVEGVMGLFDGIDAVNEEGSTAEMAKLIGAPVVLVVDARSQARSAAALVHGFASFDPGVQVAGVIFNNVASANHQRLLADALAAYVPGVAVVGCLPKEPALAIPSRHLGLCTADENPLSESFLSRLVEVVERHLDVDLLLRLGATPPRLRGGAVGELGSYNGGGTLPHPLAPSREGRGETAGDSGVHGIPSGETSASRPLPFKGGGRVGMGSSAEGATFPAPVRIAVARDAAFCFIYEDNLRLLQEQGAELCYFSPLQDQLPVGISGIYLPGGYPELFAERLAANEPLKEQIRAAVESGMPVYAECGGFIYLTRGVESDGTLHPLAGIFPVATRMLPRRKALGYREVALLQDSIIGKKGVTARGHEFHYSEMEEMPESVERIYGVSRKGEALGTEGFRYKNCLASYIHLHFGSSLGIAEHLVGRCQAYKKE